MHNHHHGEFGGGWGGGGGGFHGGFEHHHHHGEFGGRFYGGPGYYGPSLVQEVVDVALAPAYYGPPPPGPCGAGYGPYGPPGYAGYGGPGYGGPGYAYGGGYGYRDIAAGNGGSRDVNLGDAEGASGQSESGPNVSSATSLPSSSPSELNKSTPNAPNGRVA